jgi:hypothetical protein
MIPALLRRRESHHLRSVDDRAQPRNQRRAAPIVIPVRPRIPMPTLHALSECHAPPADNGTADARAMLDAFSSVGATVFNVSWTNSAGDPRRPRSLRRSLQSLGGPMPKADNHDWLNAVHIDGIRYSDLSRSIPALLDTSIAEGLNLLVRPYGPSIMFIQLDDLIADQLPHLAPAMFLIFETSPGSFQAWLAIPGNHDKELARRVKRGAHADVSASGATRIAGSCNFKDKYAPNFPRVTIRETQPGRMTSLAELDQLGLVAPPEDFTPASPAPPSFSGDRPWPSYAKALARAPLNREGTGPDRSRADYWWSFLAIAWGHGIDETGARLLQESPKAQFMENRCKGYVLLTAQRAAAAVERRRQQPSRHS